MRGRKPTMPPTTKPPSALPECPGWLSDDAKAEWRRLIPLLAEARILTRLDGDVLASYCETFAQWKQASITLAGEGCTYKAGHLVKRHPAAVVAASAAQMLLRLAGELGLTPVARHRLGMDIKAMPTDKSRFFSDSTPALKIAP